jgi:cell division protein FtsZ
MSSIEYVNKLQARIKVIGVGGAGGNAINTMVESGLENVEFIVANTDAQALQNSQAPYKIQLGTHVTSGLGAGANPNVGREAALEDEDRIREALEGADMVFVTAGMGGGTGTGAAPVVAKIARSLNALTVGVVTKPFFIEGRKRNDRAEAGIEELSKEVDSLIVIPNQRLIAMSTPDTSMLESFNIANQVLYNAVQGISDLINEDGLINVDFADVRTIMSNRGLALMGTGIATGPDRALKAAQEAISSPLLNNVSVQGATNILINFTGSANMRTTEIDEASRIIQDEADENVNLILGAVVDDRMEDQIKITVIATGFDQPKDQTEQVLGQNQVSSSPSYGRSSQNYTPQSYNDGTQYRVDYQRPDPTSSRSDLGMSTASYSSPAMGSPAMGSPAMGSPAMGSPSRGSSSRGSESHQRAQDEIPLAHRDGGRSATRSRPNPLSTPTRSSNSSDRRSNYGQRSDPMAQAGLRHSNAQSNLSPVGPNDFFEYSPSDGEPSSSMSEGHRVKSPDNLLNDRFWESIDQEELITSHSGSSRSRRSKESDLIPNPKWTEK